MERNANDNFGVQSSGESTPGGGFGSGTGAQAGSQGGGTSGTSDASFSREGSTDASGLADRAKTAASSVGTQVRDKAGTLKNTLADALESGAERLRKQGAGGGQIAGAAVTGGSADMIAEGNRLGQASNQLAGGLQASADWLRDADIDGLKSGVERQVKEHPGRTLAVAVGLGYLVGKAFRSK